MMLKLFVILVFAAVVFGDNSSTSSLMTFAKPNSTTTAASAPTATPTSTLKPTPTATSTATAMPTSTLKPTPTATSTATAMPTSTLKPTPTATSTATAMPTSTAATTATPTTSTQASKTTTPYPTTSLKPTNTTTPPPTTTTVLPTITPPAPGNFSLKDKNGNYCILAQFDASFNIKYDFKVGNSSYKNSMTELLDGMRQDDVNITGDCGKNETEPILVLSWPKKGPLYVFTMEFEKLDRASLSSNSTNMTSWKVHLAFNVTLKNNSKLNFPLALVNNKTSVLGKYNGSSSFSGHVGGNYFCAHNRALPFSLSSNVTNITITSVFEHMRLEPFAAEKGALDFNKNDTTECDQDHPTTTAVTPTPTNAPNDIVPIAVGCALAGLVLIVLIAYVIGRRKSHSGYEKV